MPRMPIRTRIRTVIISAVISLTAVSLIRILISLRWRFGRVFVAEGPAKSATEDARECPADDVAEI